MFDNVLTSLATHFPFDVSVLYFSAHETTLNVDIGENEMKANHSFY